MKKDTHQIAKATLNLLAYLALSTTAHAQLTDVSVSGNMVLSVDNRDPAYNDLSYSVTPAMLNNTTSVYVLGKNGDPNPETQVTLADAQATATFSATSDSLSTTMNFVLNSYSRFSYAVMTDDREFSFTLSAPSYVWIDLSVSGGAPVRGIFRSVTTGQYTFISPSESGSYHGPFDLGDNTGFLSPGQYTYQPQVYNVGAGDVSPPVTSNYTITVTFSPVTPVPEPGEWAALIAGFCILGIAGREWRKRARPQSAG